MPSVSSRNALRITAALAALCLAQTCGGSSLTVTPPPTTTTTTTLPPTPATLADLSAAVTSPEADGSLSCNDDVHARVTLTNNAASSVVVTGVVDTSTTVSGGCEDLPPYTFATVTRVAAGNSTTVVLDRGLYDGPSGCCTGGKCGGSCQFRESFDVVTSIGNVPAGAFKYTLFFSNCAACASGAGASAVACPSGPRARRAR